MSLTDRIGLILAIVTWALAVNEARKPKARIPWRVAWERMKGKTR